jgi:transposase InsO family protein
MPPTSGRRSKRRLVWDFVYDRTTSGSQLKWLSVVDEYTRECLALKVDRGITSEDVIDTLSELFVMRGVPRHVRSGNGPQFIAHALRRWLWQVGVDAMYIEPGSPWENGYAESFPCRKSNPVSVLHRHPSVLNVDASLVRLEKSLSVLLGLHNLMLRRH